MQKRLYWRHTATAVVLLMTLSNSTHGISDPLKSSIGASKENNRQEVKTQTHIEGLNDETREMLEEYQQLSREFDVLSTYNRQLQRLIDSQEEEKSSIGEQMGSLEATQREIIPLLLRMADSLREFLEVDHPFLPEERHRRIEKLLALMDRADISIGEKYQRVLEAYQIEMEYGRTIEASQGELKTDNKIRTVDFLRIGRVGLYYQTLDRQEVGHWNMTAGGWKKLSGRYSMPIRKGLRIARKQAAPDLLDLPLPAPLEATP